ncbi:BLUF domain-containing protein [Hymenobacter sediminis]|uniref:BLUF domain-containing protein n=1 Tax=Hymenobacter sediminis TaxID=2218621 RepID=UPI000DA677C2|nr:BLUF domain-containing protein [Hymenobacter sediminis]RPD44153.1 BLUF domain-containing protein [Hymenobacter sediminis]
MASSLLHTPEQRRRAVALAVALASGAPLAPQGYEYYLLALFQRGQLTLPEVGDLLDLGSYQVLYHSRASHSPSDVELLQLLEQARAYNARHQLTGLLLYSHGRYVQVLEGREADVRTVYARIQRDPRHQQVVTVCQGPGPHRRFADWRMGLGYVERADLERVLAAPESATVQADEQVEDAHLRALLDAFTPHPLTVEVPGPWDS